MQSENYFLVLSGTLIDGHDREQVEQGLQRLLGVSAERAKEMLSGKRSRIRKPLPLDKARHLRDKLVACGAGSFIEPEDRKAAMEAERAAASDNAQQLAETEQAAPVAVAEVESSPADKAAEPASDEQIDQPQEEEIVLSSDGPPQAAPATDSAQEQDPGDPGVLELEPLEVEVEQETAEAAQQHPEAGGEDERQAVADYPQAEPEIDQEVTRPLEAVEVVEEESFEVVLESRLEPLPPVGVRPVHSSEEEEAKPKGAGSARPVFGRPLLMAAGGLLIVLAAAAGGWYFFAGSEPAGPPVKAQAAPITPSSKVVTAQRLESLERAVRAWIKFYGSGDPGQVSLDRISQDLEMAAEELLDGWGSKIAYQSKQNGYTLVSAGPDRRLGTADDIERHSQLKTN